MKKTRFQNCSDFFHTQKKKKIELLDKIPFLLISRKGINHKHISCQHNKPYRDDFKELNTIYSWMKIDQIYNSKYSSFVYP